MFFLQRGEKVLNNFRTLSVVKRLFPDGSFDVSSGYENSDNDCKSFDDPLDNFFFYRKDIIVSKARYLTSYYQPVVTSMISARKRQMYILGGNSNSPVIAPRAC